jgi:tRNA (guanine-N7-)-methyltransferase
MTEQKHLRKIRSFVLREGRMTVGQTKAMEAYWPKYGLQVGDGLIDYAETFGRNDSPTVLEIGFGMGKSFVEMAAAAPESNFIGIEVHRPGVGSCLNRMEQLDAWNIRIYNHDAIEILDQCIADNSLDTVQLFFPDPWPKKKHHKRRIVQAEFVQKIRTKLKDGGQFHMATDWENYAEHMLEIMQAAEGWQNQAADNGYIPRPEHRPLTKFEQRGQKLGHGVWDLIFVKTTNRQSSD